MKNIFSIEALDKRDLLPAVFGIVFVTSAYFPGLMSNDSIVQYEQSRTLLFSNWHPAVMAFIWSLTSPFTSGPAPMLIFHQILLWLALYIVQTKLIRPNFPNVKFPWIYSVAFCPWILNFSGVIWKDVGLAFALFFSTALMLRSPTKGNLLLALAAISYATLVRHNGLAAAIPVAFLISHVYLHGKSILIRIVSSLMLIVAILGIGNLADEKIFQVKETHPESYGMLDDLTYLSFVSKQSLVPELELSEINACAKAQVGGGADLVGKIFCYKEKYPEKAELLMDEDLRDPWFKAIMSNPIDYGKYRLSAWSLLLGNFQSPPFYYWHSGIVPNDYGLQFNYNGVTLLVDKYIHAVAAVLPWVFKPITWLWLAGLALFWNFQLGARPTRAITSTLLFSAILYIVGYIPTTSGMDFRFVYWTALATTVSIILLFMDWLNTKNWKRDGSLLNLNQFPKLSNIKISSATILIFWTGICFGLGNLTTLVMA